jgi:hypothetical protein
MTEQILSQKPTVTQAERIAAKQKAQRDACWQQVDELILKNQQKRIIEMNNPPSTEDNFRRAMLDKAMFAAIHRDYVANVGTQSEKYKHYRL